MKTIILLGNPISTQNLYRNRGNITYMTKQGKEMKESYQWQTKIQWQGYKCFTEPLKIDIKLYFGDQKRRDWDNFHKLSCDALQGIVYKDDSQIKKATVEMRYDKKTPRIEIQLTQLPEGNTLGVESPRAL